VSCVGGVATCPGLVCKFSRVDGTQNPVIVEATFISEGELQCTLPKNTQFGFSASAKTQCTVYAGDCYGEIYVQVSVNGEEYTTTHGTTVYTYSTPATFSKFSPNAGSVAGSTNMTVEGTMLDIPDVHCMFGQTKVMPRNPQP